MVRGRPLVGPVATAARPGYPRWKEVVMVVALAACARLTSRQNAVWKACSVCGLLAPLAPDQARCADCESERTRSGSGGR